MPTTYLERKKEHSPTKDLLVMLGGAALVMAGVSIILSNSGARRYVGQLRLGDFAKEVLPDIERYLKLRSM